MLRGRVAGKLLLSIVRHLHEGESRFAQGSARFGWVSVSEKDGRDLIGKAPHRTCKTDPMPSSRPVRPGEANCARRETQNPPCRLEASLQSCSDVLRTFAPWRTILAVTVSSSDSTLSLVSMSGSRSCCWEKS